jgi:VanZ family protein
LKQKKLILVLGLLVIAPFFFLAGPGYDSTRSFQCFWDLGHIVFFALGAIFLLSFSKRLSGKTFWQQFFWVILITIVLGVSIEMTQAGLNRTPSVSDMLRNIGGSLLALFFLNPSRQLISRGKLKTLQMLTLLFIVFFLYPLTGALTDEWIARKDFPVLSDFETPMEASRWNGGAEIEISRDVAQSRRSSLKVFLNTSKYSGTFLEYFPRNWKGYSALSFEAYNPNSEPLQITCRLHDRQHMRGIQYYSDRFNKRYLLKKGWNTVRIDLEEVANAPKTRKMDMGEIYALGIFAIQLPQPRVIYLDNVRLLKKPVGSL